MHREDSTAPMLVDVSRPRPELVLSSTVRPLVEAIEDVNPGITHPEAIRRTCLYVERLWDAGIVLAPSAQILARRTIPLVVAILVFAAGVLVGNVDPIRWDLPYLDNE